MKIIRVVSLVLWALLIGLIVEYAVVGNLPVVFLIIVTTTLLGLMIYMFSFQMATIGRIRDLVDKIDLSELKDEIIKTREMENEFFMKKFGREIDADVFNRRLDGFSGDIDDYKREFARITREYEMTYRDMARKVLELDNEMNKKFKLLGEAILKLKDKK